MKPSPIAPQEEYLTENPYEFRTKHPDPPWFTISSFFAVPVLTLASLPILKDALRSQTLREDIPNGDGVNGLAFLMGLFVVAGAASLLGLVLADRAGRRDEPWKGLRIMAWIVNGIVAIRFFFWLLQIALFALVFISGRS